MRYMVADLKRLVDGCARTRKTHYQKVGNQFSYFFRFLKKEK
jgi:hypothetical protein